MSRRLRFHWFEERRDGSIRLRLLGGEVATLLSLLDELRELLQSAESDDPAYRRLFPNAYLDPTEEQAEQSYAALAHSSLLSSRLDQLTLLRELLGGSDAALRSDDDEVVHVALDEENSTLLLGVLNDVRLALGSALNVADDDPEFPDDPVGPTGQTEPTTAGAADLHPARYLYGALTNLQGELIEILLARTPEDGLETAPGDG